MEILYGFSRPVQKNACPTTLILDLDETLVHSWENPNFLEQYAIYEDPSIYRKFHPIGSHQIAYSMLLEMPGNKISKIWGLHRPHLYEFLKFASEYFDNILVWSAGIRPYVDEIAKQIFLESGLKSPKIVWARDRCANYQGYYHKPISDVMTELSKRPYTTFNIDPKWTFIVDDKSHTFMQNPQNGILIPPYHPGKDRKYSVPTLQDLLDRSDTALIQLKTWLEKPEVRNAEDVRILNKTQIFTA